MSYEQSLSYIHSFTRFGSQLGLERIEKLLELLGNPHKKLKFVHIAGTNGKGSTTKMCSHILQESGYKVGMYISPFVIDFRERFQINSKMIPKDEFVKLVSKVKKYINFLNNQGVYVTEFEVITAIGFLYFYEHNCDIVCLEVGLGGKYDATNIIDVPLVAIITSISLDHTDILGHTTNQIANEKAGIIKDNTSVICYPNQDIDALSVIMEHVQKTNSRICIGSKNSIKILSSNLDGSHFIYDNEEYFIPLIGKHQIYNTICVIETIRELNKKGFNINNNVMKKALASVSFPARIEILNKNPLIILDGAHNKSGVESLISTMDFFKNSKKVFIIGLMKDKDCDAIIKDISNVANYIIAVTVKSNPRAMDRLELFKIANKYCQDVFMCQSYNDAIDKAKTLVSKTDAIIICGSLYLASDMREIIKKNV